MVVGKYRLPHYPAMSRWQVSVGRAQSLHYSVGLMIIIENKPIIESN